MTDVRPDKPTQPTPRPARNRWLWIIASVVVVVGFGGGFIVAKGVDRSFHGGPEPRSIEVNLQAPPTKQIIRIDHCDVYRIMDDGTAVYLSVGSQCHVAVKP